MGSRYGGLKQLDPVGPGGETILDYAVFDAIRAGFGRVVFVIRRDFADAFQSQVVAKYSGHIRVDTVFQALDALPTGAAIPAGREKPWGTGHAVWCARDAIHEPFAVIGADDFFGRDAFVQLAAFLRTAANGATTPAPFAMVGYRLANTLSENGAVARGVCTADAGSHLRTVVENTGIRREDVGPGRKFTGEEIVSMNCWAFTPAFFPALDRQWREFVAAHGGELKSEFYLPEAVSGKSPPAPPPSRCARPPPSGSVSPTATTSRAFRPPSPRSPPAATTLCRSSPNYNPGRRPGPSV
jgi:UTP-glucose-1-phosphate uridylyltransferase